VHLGRATMVSICGIVAVGAANFVFQYALSHCHLLGVITYAVRIGKRIYWTLKRSQLQVTITVLGSTQSTIHYGTH
jgi:hypothetical protein